MMGLVHLTMGIANPAVPQKVVRRKFLIDSGAIFSVAPSAVLRRLGIEPHEKRSFTLANGDVIRREVGTALFRYKRRRAGAPIIFGEPGDADIVGVMTLEALGLALDPLKRELRPLPMLLV
jgi:predicted aspartyl protease